MLLRSCFLFLALVAMGNVKTTLASSSVEHNDQLSVVKSSKKDESLNKILIVSQETKKHFEVQKVNLKQEIKELVEILIASSDRWIQATKKYSDPKTKYRRSESFARQRLKTAQGLLKRTVFKGRSLRPGKLDSLEKEFLELKPKTQEFSGDNRFAVDAMVADIDAFLVFLKKAQDKKWETIHQRVLFKYLRDCLETLECFIDKRLPLTSLLQGAAKPLPVTEKK